MHCKEAHMRNRLWWTGLAAAMLWAGGTWAADNACVTCHRAIPEGTLAGHSFAEWEKSPHARAGVACSHCHGGQAGETEIVKAHAGVKGSGDPESAVYFRNLPVTCGGCHKDQAEGFKTSRHYRELQRTGRGPTCVSCHGAMSAAVLLPKQVQAQCALCHKQPSRAASTLAAMAQTRAVLAEVRAAMPSSGAGEPARSLRAANEAMGRAVRAWHRFKMDVAQNSALEAFQAATRARNALKKGSRP